MENAGLEGFGGRFAKKLEPVGSLVPTSRLRQRKGRARPHHVTRYHPSRDGVMSGWGCGVREGVQGERGVWA